MILFDETIRQSAADGTPFPKLLAEPRGHPRHQGRQGREAARARVRRDDHRGPRRAARAARGVPRARRALRQVARDVLDRRRHAERVLRLDERARARALRGALPGGGARADRRARGADGRRRTRSTPPRGVTGRVLQAVYTELHDQRVELEGTLLKPNMVLSGYGASDARRRRGGRRARRSTCSTATCRRRCRGSSSSPAARPTRTRPRT